MNRRREFFRPALISAFLSPVLAAVRVFLNEPRDEHGRHARYRGATTKSKSNTQVVSTPKTDSVLGKRQLRVIWGDSGGSE